MDQASDGPDLVQPSRNNLTNRAKRQVFSVVPGVMLGVMLGATFGAWNLLVTLFDPLADDTPLALLTFYGPMFAAWGFASFAAARRGGRIVDGMKTGAIVGFVTILVFTFANLVRVNLFLDSIQNRLDWRNMMVRFHDSDFDSLRAFVNYEYMTGFWLKVLVGALIGATVGLVAGGAARAVQHFASGESASRATRA